MDVVVVVVVVVAVIVDVAGSWSWSTTSTSTWLTAAVSQVLLSCRNTMNRIAPNSACPSE